MFLAEEIGKLSRLATSMIAFVAFSQQAYLKYRQPALPITAIASTLTSNSGFISRDHLYAALAGTPFGNVSVCALPNSP